MLHSNISFLPHVHIVLLNYPLVFSPFPFCCSSSAGHLIHPTVLPAFLTTRYETDLGTYSPVSMHWYNMQFFWWCARWYMSHRKMCKLAIATGFLIAYIYIVLYIGCGVNAPLWHHSYWYVNFWGCMLIMYVHVVLYVLNPLVYRTCLLTI